jgi:hypothetical protein
MGCRKRCLGLLLCTLVFLFPIVSRAQLDGEAGWPERQKLWLSRIDAQSMAFNRDGFAAYSKKDYEAAAASFEKAIKRDYRNCFAQYNLACTLSLLYGQGKRGDEVFDKIVQHLTEAIGMDSHWLERVFVDTDFNPIRRKAVQTGLSIPGPVDSRLDYVFFRDGRADVKFGYDDLVGGPDPGGAPAVKQKQTPQPEPTGRYVVLGTSVLVVIPGLDSTLGFITGGMQFGSDAPEKEPFAGSPGADYQWLNAKLDSNGNVVEIFYF